MKNERESLINIFLEYNSKINLSAISNFDDVYTKHILDSLELMKILEFREGKKVLDIGTGGGFPLLSLAIENPKIKFVGVDSRKKKVNVVNNIINELNIKNANIVRSRIEEYSGQFDYLTARAVGYIDKIINWSWHLVKKGGYFIFYKKKSEEEFLELKKICKQKNIKIIKIYNYSLFENDIERVIYILEK